MRYLEAKSFFQDLLEKECRKNNLDISIFSTGRLSYFNSEFFKKEIKRNLNLIRSKNSIINLLRGTIDSIHLLILPMYANGNFNTKSNSLIVFLNDVGSPILNNDITRLLYTTYHELHHALYYKQKKEKFDTGNFERFACDLESFLLRHSPEVNAKYYFQHDNFMLEILASQYGIIKAEEYIAENPNTHHYNIDKLNRLKKHFQKKRKNYDLSYYLEIIIQSYSDCLRIKGFDKSLFELFLNDNGSFKDIANISNEQLQQINPKIISEFTKTLSFQKAIREQALQTNVISGIEDDYSKTK